MNQSPSRCALVALIGRPNAGKSTLLNALVGARVGIISAKPNTTRLLVRGVQTLGETQLVWLDTPGLTSQRGSAKRGFDRALQQQAATAQAEADVVVVVVETLQALRDLSEEERWIAAAAQQGQPLVVALSKVDKLPQKAALLPLLGHLGTLPVAAVVPLSAAHNLAVAELAAAVAKLAPTGPHLFPSGMVTDQPLPERLAELTREQALRLLQAEVPYGIQVQTDAMTAASGEAPCLVQQTLLVAKASHKAMVLGAGGQKLKQLGTQARHAMQQVLAQGVRLELQVKVLKK